MVISPGTCKYFNGGEITTNMNTIISNATYLDYSKDTRALISSVGEETHAALCRSQQSDEAIFNGTKSPDWWVKYQSRYRAHVD